MFRVSNSKIEGLVEKVDCLPCVYENRGPAPKTDPQIVGFHYSKHPNKVPLISETSTYPLVRHTLAQSILSSVCHGVGNLERYTPQRVEWQLEAEGLRAEAPFRV